MARVSRRLWPVLVFGVVLASVVVLVRPALAKSSSDLSWTYDQLWPIIVRYVRVDMNAPITDKDREGGYILFTVQDDAGHTYRGSLQLARVTDWAGRKVVRLSVDLGGLPSYREVEVLQGIEGKARAELGYPEQPALPDAGAPPPAPRPDAGTRPPLYYNH